MRYAEVASSFQNWVEHADPKLAMTKAEFDTLTLQQRIARLEDASGPETDSLPGPCSGCGALCEHRLCSNEN